MKAWDKIDHIVLFAIGGLYALLFVISLLILIRTTRKRLYYHNHNSSGYIPVSTFTGTVNNDTFSLTHTQHLQLQQLQQQQKPSRKLGWQLVFHPLLMLGCAMRSIYFFLSPFIHNGTLVIAEWVQVTVSTLPSFFYFSDFLIILFLWAEIYHNTTDGGLRINRLRPMFTAINVILYFALTVLYVVNFSVAGDDTVITINDATEITIVVFACIVYLTTSLGFLLYGCKLYSKLRGKHSKHTQRRQNVLTRIKFITTVVTICFFIRAIFEFTNIFLTIPMKDEWWFFSVYYIALELFPLIMMMRLLHGGKKQHQQQQQHLPDSFGSLSAINA